MKKFNITVNGQTYDVQVEEVGSSPSPVAPIVQAAPIPAVTPAAPTAHAPAAAPAPATPDKVTPTATAGTEELNSPMPGTIVNILVKPGDNVSKGDVILVLEAMKMENEIMSPRDAVVAGVHVNKGESVDSGKLLISLQ
ncbi:MAG: biotin/lipoyl-binding protein [Oscillospiraceae bacterium]|nr:biotin/lipoyl-binding protein [Oscillospiraceae bacterium]